MIGPVTHIDGVPLWQDMREALPATPEELAATFSHPLPRVRALLHWLKTRKLARPSKRVVRKQGVSRGRSGSQIWVRA